MAAGDVTIHQVIDRGDGLMGKRLIMGIVQLDGSNPTPIALSGYVSAIEGAVAVPSIATPGIPVDGYMGVSVSVSGTTVNLYAWGTSGSDPTPTDSTDDTNFAMFLAWGRR